MADASPLPPGYYREYTVKKGDTYSSVARELGVPLSVLLSNNEYDPRRLPVGAKLNVPIPRSEIPVKPFPQRGATPKIRSYGVPPHGTLTGEQPGRRAATKERKEADSLLQWAVNRVTKPSPKVAPETKKVLDRTAESILNVAMLLPVGRTISGMRAGAVAARKGATYLERKGVGFLNVSDKAKPYFNPPRYRYPPHTKTVGGTPLKDTLQRIHRDVKFEAKRPKVPANIKERQKVFSKYFKELRAMEKRGQLRPLKEGETLAQQRASYARILRRIQASQRAKTRAPRIVD